MKTEQENFGNLVLVMNIRTELLQKNFTQLELKCGQIYCHKHPKLRAFLR